MCDRAATAHLVGTSLILQLLINILKHLAGLDLRQRTTQLLPHLNLKVHRAKWCMPVITAEVATSGLPQRASQGYIASFRPG